MKHIRSSVMLLLAALFWGTAFVAQSEGAKTLDAYTFNAVRMTLGGIVLIPCIFLLDKLDKKRAEQKPTDKRMLALGGVCCGGVLFVASTLQQYGMDITSAGKAGFITTLYIVLVPLAGLFLKKRVPFYVWISVVLATCGLYLLCVTENFTIIKSDLWIFLSAFAFAGHILVIDYFAPKVDPVRLSCIQFFVAGALSAVFMVLFGKPTVSGIQSAWVELVYMGLMSCGVAYTLQVVAQKDADPTIASLLMSMESVFAVLSGWLIQHVGLSGRELTGCVLMFAAVILSQLPERKASVKRERQPVVQTETKYGN